MFRIISSQAKLKGRKEDSYPLPEKDLKEVRRKVSFYRRMAST